MTQEVLKLALEALEVLGWQPTEEAMDYRDNAITAIKEALAQSEQEPVAWFSPSGNLYKTRFHATANGEQVVTPLYTAPPQRTWERPWVSLTDDEIDQLPTHLSSRSKRRLYCTIEAKLKEKNT